MEYEKGPYYDGEVVGEFVADMMVNDSVTIELYIATLIRAYIVIPAPHQVRDKLQQESRINLDSGSSPE